MDSSIIKTALVNNYDKTSWISKLFLNWACDLFWKFYKGINIAEEIAKNAPNALSAKVLEKKTSRLMKKGNCTVKNPRLFWIFINLAWKNHIIATSLQFLKNTALALVMAYLMGLVITSFSTTDNHFFFDRYWSSAIIIFIMCITTIFIPHVHFNSEIVGATLRIASSSLVYQKILKITLPEISRLNIGQLINIFASDVVNIEEGTRFLSFKAYEPLVLILVIIYIQVNVGLPGLISLFFLLAVSILLTFLTKAFNTIGKKKSKLTDQRLKLTTELITEIKTMKMLCWEEQYSRMIKEIRRQELKQWFWIYCLKITHAISVLVAMPIALFLTLYLIVLMERPCTPQIIYPAFMALSVAQTGLIVMFGKSIELCVNTWVSVKRTEKILKLEEKVDGPNCDSVDKRSPELTNVISSWFPCLSEEHFILKPINLLIPLNAVTTVTGPVGSGKSTLLLTMANEMYIHSGKISMGGSVTYMPQEPWLFPATIKQNIVFGLPYDDQRYKNVAYSCALIQDFEIIPNGDESNVDDKGLTLSGGQKARIALARALYRNSDVYLLDDPLSAVDVKVGKHIWKNCFQDKGKVFIIVSHHLKFLKENDPVIYIEKGCVTNDCYGEIKVNYNHSLMECSMDGIDNIMEKTNEVVKNVHFKEIEKSNANGPTETTKSYSQKEYNVLLYCKMAGKCCNGWGVVILVLLLALISQSSVSAFYIYFAKWLRSASIAAEDTVDLTNISSEKYGPSLSGLGALIVILTITSTILYSVFFAICYFASRALHEKMLRSVIRTNLAFYNTHNTGDIINRFSADVNKSEGFIPTIAFEILKMLLVVISYLVNASYSNYAVTVVVVLAPVVGIAIYSMYIKAARYLNVKEASDRGPIYGYMKTTVTGVSVIRSHENQMRVMEEFAFRQNQHTTVWFLLKGVRWFITFIFEILGAVITICIVIVSLVWPQLTNSSRIGLGLTSTYMLGSNTQYLILLLTDFDHVLHAVSRIMEYIALPAERGYVISINSIPPQWPSMGQIKFQNLTLFYKIGSIAALKNISFEAQPGEKIGIVGRTGAGKSSLVAALFRLAYTEGTIEIDGIDIDTLPVVEYRKTISIIPQNPVILSGSVRYNLDPLCQFEDNQLWEALDCVELKDEVAKKGLDNTVNQFSVGQKQLFCLARTLLLKNKIIILDEATSNVDNRTDKIIQALIRSKFQNSTILVIAHRLQTIIDLDKVMVMQNGEIAEFDSPGNLLNNPHSIFRSLAQTYYKMANNEPTK